MTDLDAMLAALPAPLVVHRGIIGERKAPCGVLLVVEAGEWAPIASLHPHRVTCPDCVDTATPRTQDG